MASDPRTTRRALVSSLQFVLDFPARPLMARVIWVTKFPKTRYVCCQAADCILRQNLTLHVQLVIMNLFAGNHDPTAFDQPDKFLPERWLDGHKGRTDLLGVRGDKLGVPHLTYGAGRRVCPGIDRESCFPSWKRCYGQLTHLLSG